MRHLNNYIRSIVIGGLTLPHNIIAAPLAGISDFPFRELSRRFGAKLTFTEMISVTAWINNPRRSRQYLRIRSHEHPVGIQLLGQNPDDFVEILPDMETFSPEVLDINFGCPMKKVVKSGSGSSLLKDIDRVYRIILSVAGNTSIPVTAKIRLGWQDKSGMGELVSAIESAGAAAITVHGRTREQGYDGTVDLDAIARVKQLASVPVIGNGNVFSARAAEDMFRRTGVDGIMLARGIIGKPWLFTEILGENELISQNSALEVLQEHYRLQMEEYGELRAIRRMRKLIPAYLQQVEGAEELKVKMVKAETFKEIKDLFLNFRQDRHE